MPGAFRPSQNTTRPDAPESQLMPMEIARPACTTPAGRQKESIDADGKIWTTVFDKADRPIAQVNPNNQRTTTVYDDAGQAIATIDPLLHVNTTVYDPAGRTIASINGVGDTTQYGYDLAGRQTSGWSMAMAKSQPASTTTTVGRSPRLMLRVFARPGCLMRADGSPTRSTKRGKTTTTVYDKVNRTLSVTNPLLQTQTYCLR
jgi:YD repeat-containing protein